MPKRTAKQKQLEALSEEIVKARSRNGILYPGERGFIALAARLIVETIEEAIAKTRLPLSPPTLSTVKGWFGDGQPPDYALVLLALAIKL